MKLAGNTIFIAGGGSGMPVTSINHRVGHTAGGTYDLRN